MTEETIKGNLVYSYQNKIQTVFGVLIENNFNKVYTDKDANLYFHIEGLKPIPLSEEWLVRLGLIQRSDMKQCFLLKCVDERVFCVYLDLTVGYQLLIETNKDSGVWHVIAKDLKHVHTLQNLIHALTGTELTLTDK